MSADLPDYFAKHPCLPQHTKTKRTEGKKSNQCQRVSLSPLISISESKANNPLTRLYLLFFGEVRTLKSALESYLDEPDGVRELKRRNCAKQQTSLPQVRTAGKYAPRRPP